VTKRKIGIDFDDVAVDTFPAFLAFCNERYNEQFRVEEFTSFRYDGVWKITKEQGRERFIAFDNSEAKRNICPMLGAQKAIKGLAIIHELHIITARPVEIAEGTREMIDRHFPKMFKDVHFCSSDNGAILHRPKPMACKEIDVALHIEDHPETARRCADKGVPVLLFDRTWNRSEETHDLITRVHSWDEIFKILSRP